MGRELGVVVHYFILRESLSHEKKTLTQIKVSKAAYGVRYYRNYVIISIRSYTALRQQSCIS